MVHNGTWFKLFLETCGWVAIMGNRMVSLYWFCIISIKKDDYWSKRIGFNKGPTKDPKVPKAAFGCPKCTWIMVECLGNAILSFGENQYWK
jgi:hypothetical protein